MPPMNLCRISRHALFAVLLVAGTAAPAQNYPTHPIRLLVPSTPGGSVDTFARMIGSHLSERWGQQVVIENRPGAGGTIAAELTAKAAPDGYTLIAGTVAAMATNVSIYRALPYHPLKDFAPVTLIARQALMLLVHPTLPARSVRDLIALAKSRPGQLSFASAGNGSGGHLSAELFKLTAGIELQHVPYKGVAPAIVDVISGQVEMTFSSILSALPHVKSARLRALAVTSAQRSTAAPDVPTMQQGGVAGFESSTWYGVLAPGATPPEIVDKLYREISAGLRAPEARARISAEGADPVGNTPAEFRAFIAAEIDKWAKVVMAAGIQPG